MAKLIIGLGNPGTRYAGTRHNLGFVVVSRLSDRWRIPLGREKFHAKWGDGAYKGRQVALLQPMTFMNLSGQSVWPAVKFYQAAPEDLLVIVDDTALPLGKLRMRTRGSAGGHNGLQNIIDRVGSDEFHRLRLGIDNADCPQADYVLSRFGDDEQPAVERMVGEAVEAVETWLEDGAVATMNRVN